MIISHKHSFIFFAVPKTATHSIREALHQYKGEDDWEQQVLFGEQAIPVPSIAAIRHGHISVRQIAPELSLEQYFKFAFVRNPFDRFISICAFLNRANPHYPGGEVAWMKSAIKRPAFLQRILVRPQAEQLIDDNGEIGVDYLGRYEKLQASMDDIFKQLGLPPVPLQVRNRSEHTGYRDYYDDELLTWTTRFYQQDIELFSYEF